MTNSMQGAILDALTYKYCVWILTHSGSCVKLATAFWNKFCIFGVLLAVV